MNPAFLFDLPLIENVESLAEHLRLSGSLVYKSAFTNQYHEVVIPKCSGGARVLYCPTRNLKIIQLWILRRILERVPVDDHATAYVRKKQLVENVRRHQSNPYFLALDIEEFFPSISSKQVAGLYYALGYRKKGLSLLVALGTHNGFLPQGAVTSPALANLLCKRMDRRIAGYVERRGVQYTRYADDLTFSARDPRVLRDMLPMLQRIITEEGFRENASKRRQFGPNRRQMITGLVQGTSKFGIGRQREHQLRGLVYRSQRFGYEQARVQGWLSYLHSVDDKRFRRLSLYADTLTAWGSAAAARSE